MHPRLQASLAEFSHRGAGHGYTQSVLAPLAAILLLRWADRDGAVPSLRDGWWDEWCVAGGQRLVAVLRDMIAPSLLEPGSGMLRAAHPRLAPVIGHLLDAPPKTRELVVRLSRDLDPVAGPGRRAAGEALGSLVERVSAGAQKSSGEFTTPPAVVELMLDLVEPRPGERIYDPSFGTGGLLASAAGRILETSRRTAPEHEAGLEGPHVFGMEIDPVAYAIGLARVVLAGVDSPALELGDTLKRPTGRDPRTHGYDCILAVPPWGRRVPPAVAAKFPVPALTIETLFLQHVMGALRRGGRAVVAVPDSVLFRTGRDRIVRRELLSSYWVEGVVSLPSGAFRPYTGIKTSLIVFRRARPRPVVRFLQVDRWPAHRPDDSIAHEHAVGAARQVAAGFRRGTPGSGLWETPVAALARDWELVAKRTGEQALAKWLEAIREADAAIPVLRLDNIAEMFAGVPNEHSGAGTDDGEAIGLLRVADLRPGGVRQPTRVLSTRARARVKARHRLRAGDLLLSTSGTIGKLGLVDKSPFTLPTVAAKGLAVMRPGAELKVDFLRCILGSDTYQGWLRGHARGSTIQHLAMFRLRRLRIPVPGTAVQKRVVRQVLETGIDPLAALAGILTRGGEDPVLSWLRGSAAAVELRRPHPDGDPAAFLERVAESVEDLHAQITPARDAILPALARWLKELTRAVAPLRGLDQVPPGAGRLAILDSVQLRLGDARSALGDSPLPAVESARVVTSRISRLVGGELESLLKDVRLEPSVELGALVPSAGDEVQVRLKNASCLALRNIVVSTAPDIGSTTGAYLAEGTSLGFPARIHSDVAPGLFRFRLHWRGERLDGTPVTDEAPLAVELRDAGPAPPSVGIGPSPYIVGNPIDREEMFFGRQDIIDRIQLQLSTGEQANVVLLEGNRRTGKTSILRHLQTPGILPDWIVVDCSLQAGVGDETRPGLPTVEVFRLMARKIAGACHDAGLHVWFPGVPRPDPDKPFGLALMRGLREAFSDDGPFEAFELYLRTVLDAAKPRRLLLMLDEFDKLQEGIDAGITSPQVPENIRYLMHTYPSLSAILAGSRRIKRLREEYWSALFGIGHRVGVSKLPVEHARALVTRPVEGRLTYVPEAADRVVEDCAQQPFLIQSLANRIFENAALANQPNITVSAVDAAGEQMVADNEHFRTLWDYAATDRRRFLLALCERLDKEPDPITLTLLETKLEEYGIVLRPTERLGADLDFLRELELLQLRFSARGSAYALAVPLMARWIRKNVDFEDQRRKAQESRGSG